MDQEKDQAGQVMAVLVSPQAASPGGVFGSGILIDKRLAVIALDEEPDEELGLHELEVNISPVQPGRGDRVERIRPAVIRIAQVTTDPPRLMAAVALAHSSHHEGVDEFDAADMVAAFENAGGVLEGFREMGMVTELPPRGADLVDHIGELNTLEREIWEPQLERWDPTSPYNIGKFCCSCSPKCHQVDPDPVPIPGPPGPGHGPGPGPGPGPGRGPGPGV